MNTIKMEDVPREVWDEVQEKWSSTLATGWSPSMWCGCSLCAWMATELGVGRMGDVDCELCPLYKDEWCRSLPEESKIHPEYYVDCEYPNELWEDRINEFLAFIKPYCSREGKVKLRDEVLEYIREHNGMYDMVGVSMYFNHCCRSTIYGILHDLLEEGLIEKNRCVLFVRGVECRKLNRGGEYKNG